MYSCMYLRVLNISYSIYEYLLRRVFTRIEVVSEYQKVTEYIEYYTTSTE